MSCGEPTDYSKPWLDVSGVGMPNKDSLVPASVDNGSLWWSEDSNEWHQHDGKEWIITEFDLFTIEMVKDPLLEDTIIYPIKRDPAKNILYFGTDNENAFDRAMNGVEQ